MNKIECPSCGRMIETLEGDYQYLESGLDNVVLCGFEIIKCTCGEESVILPRILEIHNVIAECILEKKTQITGKEIRFLRKNMGLKGKIFANLVGVDHATLSRWENGKAIPSLRADRLIRFLYANKMKKPEKAEELASRTFEAIRQGQPAIPIHVIADRLKHLSCSEECQ